MSQGSHRSNGILLMLHAQPVPMHAHALIVVLDMVKQVREHFTVLLEFSTMSPLILAGQRGVRIILLFHFPDPCIYTLILKQFFVQQQINVCYIYMQAIHIICDGDFLFLILAHTLAYLWF